MVTYHGLENRLNELGLTRSDLTRKLGISSRTVAKIAKGEKLSEGTLDKIASFLDCDPSGLMEDPETVKETASLERITGSSGMKKVVIFGGGTGISAILTGLKLFPLEVTAVIAVSDDGSSTGVLKEELDIPAVGDLGKVLLAMNNVDEDFVRLLSYRFRKSGSLQNHPVRNILLAALIDLKGDLTEAAKYMGGLLKVKGTVLPLTEEKVELIGYGDQRAYVGEVAVSSHIKDIEYLTYDHPIKVNREVVSKVLDADLIVFSPGSLYTSIIPHLIAREVRDALEETPAPIMYISNLVTQPGETDGYSVGDHIKVLNKYLKGRKVDMVIANSGTVAPEIAAAYRIKENKYKVELDREEIEAQGAKILADDLIKIDLDLGTIVHDELKTAYIVFSSLM